MTYVVKYGPFEGNFLKEIPDSVRNRYVQDAPLCIDAEPVPVPHHIGFCFSPAGTPFVCINGRREPASKLKPGNLVSISPGTTVLDHVFWHNEERFQGKESWIFVLLEKLVR